MRAKAALVLALAALTACESASDEVTLVDKGVLQQDVAQRLADVGVTPRSVVCHDDLIGEVGRTARCDVVVSDNGFQPVATVTRTDGDTVDYVLAPALSQEQIERAVGRLTAERTGAVPDSVACESGLPGMVGAVAHCDVVAADVRERRTVVVTEVTGLIMKFDLRSS